MVRIILFIICCLISIYSFGQCLDISADSLRNHADSLHQAGNKPNTPSDEYRYFNDAIKVWKCLDSLYGYTPNDALNAAKSYGNRAFIIEDNESFHHLIKQALDDITYAIDIKRQHRDHIPQNKLVHYGGNLRQRAKIYKLIGDYENAIKDQNEAFDIFTKIDNVKDVVNSLNEIGKIYNEQKESKEAITVLNKALKEANRISDAEKSYFIGQIRHNLGNAYDDLEEFKQAKIHYEEASEHYNISLENLPDRVDDIESDISDLNNDITITYRKLRQFDEAHHHLKNAKKDAPYHNNKGDIYRNEDKLELALYHHNQALVLHINDFSGDVGDTPEKYQLNKVSTKPDLLTYLASKAETANLIGNKIIALNTYRAYDHTVGMMRREHASDQTKLQWIAGVRPVYERAIRIAIETDSTELAFRFMEKSRTVLLMDRLRDLDAKAFSGIPDSLLQDETELAAQLVSVEDDNERDSIENQLNTLIDNFEQNYPEYYALKYDLSTPDIDSVQHNLEKNTTLVEYFYGDSTIYAFFISNDSIEIDTIPRDTVFDNNLQSFKKDVLHSHPSKDALFSVANRLYEVLLSDYLNQQKEGHRLIIIPDGQLHGVPFEALLTEPFHENDKAFPPYLIRQNIITYSYSVQALLQGDNNKIKAEKTWLGIAPLTYDNIESNDLYELPEGEPFVKKIQGFTGGAILLGEDATLKRFEDTVLSFQVIHFHTHAIADSTNEPYIFFYDDALYLRRLYSLPLQADLVTLSACETGTGELLDGEGVMSLARGFKYQGVSSIVMTLTNVDEESATDIMTRFYKNLFKGKDKALALHEAKRTYLDESKGNRKLPYYWASLIHIGNTQPIDITTQSQFGDYWWLLLLLVLAGLIYLYFVRGRKS